MPHWKETTLSEIGAVVTGKTPSTANPDYFGGDIPFVTPRDMVGNRFISSTERNLTESGVEAVKGSSLPPKSIMVSCIGSDMGKVAIAGRNCVTNQQINSIIANEGIVPEYVYYNLLLRQEEIKLKASGSAVPILNKSHFSQLHITIPDFDEQKRIASILGSLDDKIELNRKQNETLEAMARALFQSWFVDFDPVMDNAIESKKPIPAELADNAARRKAAKGKFPALPKEIRKLFPSEFEPSPLGPIPKGWSVGKISDCCEKIENGGTPSRDETTYWEPAIIPWLTSGEVRQNIVIETQNFISELGYKNSSAKLWKERTTVVALYGATAGQVCILAKEMCTNQACCGLTPLPHMAYYNYLKVSSSVKLLEQQARGSAQQNLSKQIVSDLITIIPPSEIMKISENKYDPLFQRWILNLNESCSLSRLRDTLLPKLLSGKVII